MKKITDDNQTITEDGLVFHPGLSCFVGRIEYDWRTQTGLIEGNACFTPLIELFQRIDPNVREIECLPYIYGRHRLITKDTAGAWHCHTLTGEPRARRREGDMGWPS